MSQSLKTIVRKLDQYFAIDQFGPDPSMSRFVPMVFDGYFNWQKFFSKKFNKLFNGLVIEGDLNVGQIFTSVFPTTGVLKAFIQNSDPGDLLFLHHPIEMSCGGPRGERGKGFLPIKKELLKKIKAKSLSVYSCHIPLDCNQEIGTNEAIIKALDAKKTGNFAAIDQNFFGRFVEIEPISTQSLIKKLEQIFEIPYVDFGGKKLESITKVAVIAGSGDKVEYFRLAEEGGAQAFVTGEIHSHIDNEKGRAKMAEAKEYMKNTQMSFIGVSHAASEFLVMKTQMPKFFKENFNLKTTPLEMKNWWN